MRPVVVVDASIAVKWFVPVLPEEENSDAALELLKAYRDDLIEFYQPPVWRSEVLALLARIVPDKSEQHAWNLVAMDYTAADGHAVYLKAVQIALNLNHHLFDTIYHAAALTHPSAIFVTADNKYRLKSESLGKILPLERWREVFATHGEIRL